MTERETEFQKWIQKGSVGIGWYSGAAEGWKAALEWVLAEGIDDWLEDTIKEELKSQDLKKTH